MILFDSHAHLVSDDFQKYPVSPLSGELDRKLDDPVTAEVLLRMMDEQGVEKAVAVQRAHVYGYNNAYVVDSARRYPDRLVTVCVIDAAADDSPQTVSRWAEQGAVGMRLSEKTKGQGTGWLDSPNAVKAWEAVAQHGLSMCVHMYRWNRQEVLRSLLLLARQFPNTPLVMDHLSNTIEESGAPDYGVDADLLAFKALPNVYLKYSQINLARMAKNGVSSAAVIQRILQDFPAERVMWGSDVAQSTGTYEEMVLAAKAATTGLPPAQIQALLYGTADLVYGAKWRR
jgi:L-fuconolactonase